MTFTEFLQNNIVLLDGGMGTMLQKKGLKSEGSETWCLTHPCDVQAVHEAYLSAGSDVINTNTFGANALKYDDETLEKIFDGAFSCAKLARQNNGGKGYIALDIGPTGKLLAPFGDLEFEKAVEVFAKSVRLGVKYGADLVFIETMSDCYETKAAVLAAKENCSLPILVSNAYSENNALVTGASPSAMVTMLEGLGVTALGANCSFGPKALFGVVNELLNTSSLPVIFKPNAGLPKTVNGEATYDLTPEEFARQVASCVEKGVRIVGGCCGTTPEYIYALASAVKNIKPLPICQKSVTRVSSGTHAVTFGGKTVIIGERINPTGKKKLKEALLSGNSAYVLGEAVSQQDAGADVLDVNVGLPELDEKSVLTKTVENIQAVVNLPLQIDTSSPDAMESAMRVYNGKPLVNSVNGKKESMESVFPLVRKYGGVVVALTLDENGIPSTAEGRIAIAEKIIKTAESYGIGRNELIFDALTLPMSADKSAPEVTLNALKSIREKFGAHTVLGVSNVSFGLPQRDVLNSAFFLKARTCGLSAGIINPLSEQMMRTVFAMNALEGYDENFKEYIRFSEGVSIDVKTEKGELSLFDAIVKGLKEQAENAVNRAQNVSGLDLINEQIIPALEEVGKGFENKTVYLPSLLMSAEASKSAFEKIKERFSGKGQQVKCPFVLATVKGDIHDIGKNIVKLLLEQYGYDVIDLGKDVPADDVSNEVVRLHAPLCGLSALMTTTVPAMEETIALLRKNAPWCKIVVGGAVLTSDVAKKIGADAYASDAMATVRYAEKVFGK